MRLSSPELLVDITGLGGLREHRGRGRTSCASARWPRTPQIEQSEDRASTCRCSRRPCRTSRTPRSATAARSAAASRSPIRRRNIRPARWRSKRYCRIVGKNGERRVTAADFFKGLFETDLKPGEMLTGGRVPGAADRVGVPRARAPAGRLRDRRPRGASSGSRAPVRVFRRGADAGAGKHAAQVDLDAKRKQLAQDLDSAGRPLPLRRHQAAPGQASSLERAWNKLSTSTLTVNGAPVTPARRAAPAPGGFPARGARPDRLAHRLRARRVRRLHRARRRRDRARLPDARGAGERLPASTRSRGCPIRRSWRRCRRRSTRGTRCSAASARRGC